MRRLRAGGSRGLTHSGGRGSPSGPTMGLCRWRGWTRCGRRQGNLPDGSNGSAQYPEERSSDQKERRGGAP